MQTLLKKHLVTKIHKNYFFFLQNNKIMGYMRIIQAYVEKANKKTDFQKKKKKTDFLQNSVVFFNLPISVTTKKSQQQTTRRIIETSINRNIEQ